MRKKLLLLPVIFYCVTCLGQESPPAPANNVREATIKKQIIVDDIENQLKEVPFSAVRVFVRTKMAAWLWSSGKDETENAERLSLKAIEELYDKKSEIPALYYNVLKTDLFALLDVNAKETAIRLKAKYESSSDDDLEGAYSNLDKKDGEKRAADNVLTSLTNRSELSPAATLLMDKLQSRNSPELARLLGAIVYFEETKRNNFSPDALFLITHNFRGMGVANDLRIRFYRVILNKAGSVGVSPESAFNLLGSVMRDIAVNAPHLLPEAHALQAALTSRVSIVTREAHERNQRIEESSDKLSAMISEAEKSSDKAVKYRLHVEAGQLALRTGRLRLAVDLVEKSLELEPFEGVQGDISKSWHDQFLGEVLVTSLKKDDLDAASYATTKVIDRLLMAELLRKTAVYHSEKRDQVQALEVLDQAIGVATKAEANTMRIYSLIRLISTAQKIDKNRLSDVALQTAKSIEKIPTLNVEDKPGREKYAKYVTSIMAINWSLLPLLKDLAKSDRNEAISFGDQISKREIKVVVNYALAVGSLNADLNAEKTIRN